MSKLLSTGFMEELNKVLDYLRENEQEDFRNDEGNRNDHIYLSVLTLDSYLGNEDIDNEDAKLLLDTDLKDAVMAGNDIDGWQNLDEGEEISDLESCKLWI